MPTSAWSNDKIANFVFFFYSRSVPILKPIIAKLYIGRSLRLSTINTCAKFGDNRDIRDFAIGV